MEAYELVLKLAERQRHEIKIKGSVLIGGQRYQLTLRILADLLINMPERGRLAAAGRAVIDDLAVDLFLLFVDERHITSFCKLSPKTGRDR